MSRKFAKGKSCSLIIDQYPSHISEVTKANAKKYYIKLVYIPVSKIDKHQPLDMYTFGIMKSPATRKPYDKVFNECELFISHLPETFNFSIFLRCINKNSMTQFHNFLKYLEILLLCQAWPAYLTTNLNGCSISASWYSQLSIYKS